MIALSVKQQMIELAQQLPSNCTWDEVMYQVYVRQKIEAGLADAEAGRVIDHDEVFVEFDN